MRVGVLSLVCLHIFVMSVVGRDMVSVRHDEKEKFLSGGKAGGFGGGGRGGGVDLEEEAGLGVERGEEQVVEAARVVVADLVAELVVEAN